MKCLISAAFLFAGFASACASFDLMLIPDTSTNNGVTRYDPVNRVRLGTIGRDAAGPWNSVNLSSTPGKAWLTGNQTMLFDYSSGIATNSLNFPVGNTTSNIGGTRFVESFAIDNYFYDSSMVGAGQFTPTVSEAVTAAPIGTNRVAMIGINLGNIDLSIRNNSNGALVTRTLVTSGSFVAGTVGTATVLSDDGSFAKVLYSYRTASALVVETLAININTLFSTSSTRTFSGYAAGYTAGIMRAHDGYYVVGRDSGGVASRITAVSNAGVVYSGYTTTDFTTGASRWVGATVLAPEPGSLAAVIVGFGWVLRRAKRS